MMPFFNMCIHNFRYLFYVYGISAVIRDYSVFNLFYIAVLAHYTDKVLGIPLHKVAGGNIYILAAQYINYTFYADIISPHLAAVEVYIYFTLHHTHGKSPADTFEPFYFRHNIIFYKITQPYKVIYSRNTVHRYGHHRNILLHYHRILDFFGKKRLNYGHIASYVLGRRVKVRAPFEFYYYGRNPFF